MKKKFVKPQSEIVNLAGNEIILAASSGSLKFGDYIDSNEKQGTDFEVESRNNNKATKSSSFWD